MLDECALGGYGSDMASDTPNPITRLYRACDPREALPSGDPRFVVLDEVRGSATPSLLYEQNLRLSNPLKPEVKIFSGHLGVGKSSELLRLKGNLENPSSGRAFRVILADVEGNLDLNDLDFPDLLVFLAAEIQRDLRAAKIQGFSGTSTLLADQWDRLRSALGAKFDLTGADLDVPFASLALEIKNRPSSRGLLRGKIEEQSTNLQKAVNDLLVAANVSLRKEGWEGLVLIVDGLERVALRNLENGVTTHQRLFIQRSAQLANLAAHVVYSMPISLVYSAEFAEVEQTFGGRPIPVPMIRLRGDHRSAVTPDTPGMRKMREIVAARCRYAEVDPAEVFDSEETCHLLCEATGGHPRHLMMFLQSALSRVTGLPITWAAAEEAIREAANSLVRQIDEEEWPRLRRFVEPREEISHDPEHLAMLRHLHVFEYMNGSPWYEVNPVLRTLPKLGAAD